MHPYRTIVYIDGFNFYYGQVRGTPWKWLDPAALFAKVLGPENQLSKIRYFTARVQATPRDPRVDSRQDAYLRALTAHCPLIELHFGHFLRHRVRMENANPPPAMVETWKNEEKGSDVNLAIHLLNVVVSNDTDLAESMRLVKAQTSKLIGLVTPGAPERKTSYQLRKNADFVKPIRRWMLEQSQLPDTIPGTTIRKPVVW